MSKKEHQNWEHNESEKLHMAIYNIRHKSISEESLTKALLAAEKIAMTPQAWRQGFMNMLLVAVPTYSILGLLAYFISTIFNVNGMITTLVLFISVCLVFLLCGQINRILQSSRAGAVLIDCGICPGRNIFLVQAVLLAVMAIYFLSHGLTFTHGTIALTLVAIAGFYVHLANSHLQFCEGGIRMHLNFLPWSRVTSFEWTERTNPTLLVEAKTRWKLFRRGAFPVPARHFEEVDSLLRDRVGPTMNSQSPLQCPGRST